MKSALRPRYLCAALLAFTLLIPAAAQEDCLEKGTQLFAEKNYKQAVMLLRKCEDSPKAHRLLGLSFFELNYMEDAKKYLSKAIAANPEDVSLKIKYADAFAQNREFKRGVKEYRALLETYPENIEVKRGLARVLGWNRQYDEAIAMYQQVIEADPDDYLSRIQLGVMKSWDKRFAEAVGVFKEVIAKKPPEEFEIGARLRLAEVLSWMKKFDESVAEYDKVIALAPKTAKAYLGKGEVLEWQGKYKPAIRVYEAGLQAAPGNSDLQGRLQQLMWVK